MTRSARLAPGARLGPYEIVAPLGMGGMGEVYTAADTRLDRRVAIKILLRDSASSMEARQRFDRETRAISKLSHPHVCALFDVGREGDIDYFVMELLDGQTLAARLTAGPLPWTDAVRIGTQIAQALAAAHAQGIVHRDLKPGNVMLTQSGVKLLDFGLARPTPAVMVQDTGDDATLSVGAPLTEQGQWLGTAGYMSPEQLQGQPADTRSDVFALGVILYEMAAGGRAFGGDTLVAAASAILHETPAPLSSQRDDVPAAFDRLVQACLVKDPAARWQSAHDAALDLSAIDADATPGAPVLAPRSGRRTLAGTGAWVVAGLAIVVAASLWTTRPVPAVPTRAPIALDLLPPAGTRFVYSVETVHFAVSPDGNDLAFISRTDAGVRQIWIRPLDSLDARIIAGTDGATTAFWSPDGHSIGFFAGGFLKRLDLASGATMDLAPVRTGIGYAGTWGADTILYSSIEGESLNSVPSGGGDAVVEVKPDSARGETRVNFPLFLPDGRTFLYVERRTDGTQFLMIGEPDQPLRQVMPIESNVQYLEPGVLVYAQGGTLVGRAFDAVERQATGEAFPIADSVNFFLTTGVAAFSASPAGTLVYQAHSDVTRLAMVDRTGREVGRVGTPGAILDLRLTPDGRTALFSRGLPQTGTYDIWSLDLDRNVERRLTMDDRTTEFAPIPIDDGHTLVFSKAVSTAPRLARKVIGGVDEVTLMPGSRLQNPTDVSPDGRWVAYHERSTRGDYDIWLMPVDGSAPPHTVQQSPAFESDLRFSPDGRLYSFLSTESGTQQLYVTALEGGPNTAVSSGGALRGRWNPRGGELLYLSFDRRLVSVSVPADGRTIGSPVTLFAVGDRPWVDYAVSANGEEILAAIPQIVAFDQPLTAVLGWRPKVR